MNKKTLAEGGLLASLIGGALMIDPAVVAKLYDDITPAKAAVIIAALAFVYLRENPWTKAKIKDLIARTSVPPESKP